MKRDELGQLKTRLFKKAKKGETQSLAKLLSLVESDLRGSASFLAKLKPKKNSLRLGITGPPGAGKSTLISQLVAFYREQGLKVSIVAIDPSSPFSGGAILGDRIRMNIHGGDHDVFIRSVGSRGGLGGLSAATGAMATILEAVGFDLVIIETVGVGQTELQVMNLADATAVVLVPESGDVIQTMKAGILEIADLFVVNKSDRPSADILAHELEALVEFEADRKREIFLTCALDLKGVKTFSTALFEKGKALKADRRSSPERLQGELRNLVLWSIQEKLLPGLSKIKVKNVYASFKKFRLPK